MGRVPEIRNESEDFWGDLVDPGEAVPPRLNQAENLEYVLLESVDLKTKNKKV
jgi:hypothetical protein